MTQQEIEAFFLNHDDPVFEMIQDAETDDEAEGIADDFLSEANQDYDKHDLIEVVRKIRIQ